MEFWIYAGIVAAIIIIFAIQSISAKRSEKIKIKRLIEKAWGERPEREYSYNEFERISHYYLKKKDENCKYKIDDITWNDLDMDTIFMLLNNTQSAVGEEYLYNLLRKPTDSDFILQKRDKCIDYFVKNSDKAKKIEELFALIGRTRSISLYDFIYNLIELPHRSNIKHYLMIIGLVGSIVSLFFAPAIAILAIIFMVCINVYQYYKTKASIENYFICFKYIVNMTVISKKIANELPDDMDEYKSTINEISNRLHGLEKGISFVAGNNLSGSISDIFMDYVRILFHVDIIKFNSMLKLTQSNIDKIDELYNCLGFLESMIAIASFRVMYPDNCKPQLVNKLNSSIEFRNIYHPMIENPVKNSIFVTNNVLLTGSNASGKSTFLKTVAINAIFAQTIYTVLADSYKANYFDLYTSMALRDDLESNESYYIVEIKSLKRIIDKSNEDRHILCFVDEVLRGTNTVERISASSEILYNLNKANVMCFAATHDIELTHMLEKVYDNYHFQEEVKDDDILFNYKLYENRATSRNAIKLLSIIGYDKLIVDRAEDRARDFISTGEWKKFD